MNASAQLQAAMVKRANPAWAKAVARGLSSEAQEALAKFLPPGVTRQIGKARLGGGTEADVMRGFTGGAGPSALKNFASQTYPELRKGAPPTQTAPWIGAQIEGMNMFPDIFAHVYHPTRAGYAMELLSHKPPPGVVETTQQRD